MSFILYFSNYVENITRRVRAVVPEDKIRGLENFKKNIEDCPNETRKCKLLYSFANSFGVALWVKDLGGRLIFVNKVMRTLILDQPNDVVLFKREREVETCSLSTLCEYGDLKVIKNNVEMRFVEHAMYYGKRSVWIDVHKSPRHAPNGRIIGTLGTAISILSLVPKSVMVTYRSPQSVEIPLELVLNKKVLIGGLENQVKLMEEKAREIRRRRVRK